MMAGMPSEGASLGERLKARRGSQKQIDVAKQMVIPQGSLSKYEKGLALPSAKHIPAIAEFLGEPIQAVVQMVSDEAKRRAGGTKELQRLLLELLAQTIEEAPGSE